MGCLSLLLRMRVWPLVLLGAVLGLQQLPQPQILGVQLLNQPQISCLPGFESILEISHSIQIVALHASAIYYQPTQSTQEGDYLVLRFITGLQYIENMVKLSSYSAGYEDDDFEDKPWQFWTEEQRSQVIYEAYRQHHLTSAEVKPYLDVSQRHALTQFLIPALSLAGYYFTRHNNPLFRRSPRVGFLGGAALVGATTIWWLNDSPFYNNKLDEQVKTLDVLYHKIGTNMKLLNDLVPRTRTSNDIDIRTRFAYSKRNGFLAGTLFAEDDFAPPLRQLNKTMLYSAKKVYQ